MNIIAASQNQNKIREMDAITSRLGYHIISRDEAGVPDIEVEEDGMTFEENSFKKANEIMKMTGKICIADDSGLVVDALNGAPGVYSARFAGEHANDEANNKKLLEMLQGVPAEQRTARFVSVITMVFPDGTVLNARGECEGKIVTEERGAGGFGYDPLFIPEGFQCTFGEVTAEVKNQISHRAKALQKLDEKLRERA